MKKTLKGFFKPIHKNDAEGSNAQTRSGVEFAPLDIITEDSSAQKSKDRAYCLYCYLFAKPESRHKAFTSEGFNNWNKSIEIFNEHVGGVSSVHNIARNHSEDFQKQRQSIVHAMTSQSIELESAYQIRLTATLYAIRFLLVQGLAFRGHDESASSLNRGNFLELLKWHANEVESIRNVVGDNAPRNCQLTSPQIQKEMVSACASETSKAIISELGDKKISLLVDEARDISTKEQMAVIIRFVNVKGEIIERFLGIQHVSDTTSSTLKASLDKLFASHRLSTSRLRGQAFDGASNMRGELNGLKTLIQNENPFAFYVHCFAHQLQLVIVFVVKSNRPVGDFFSIVGMIVKTYLRNRMSDDWMNDMLICYIEKKLFNSIDDEVILQRFQNMQNRRIQLPKVRR